MKAIWMLAALMISTFAFADGVWLGNVQIRMAHRGVYSQMAFTGQILSDNLADNNSYSVSFQFYKQNVTDTNSTIWQNINAQAELVQDDTQKILKTTYISVVGKEGNNAVYTMPLLLPDTLAQMDPELQDSKTMYAHVNVIMDGVQMLSIPLELSYLPEK